MQKSVFISAARRPPLPRAVKQRDRFDRRKRAADLICSALLLFFLSLPMLLIAVWIRCDSEGPAIFRQTRLGRDLKPFTVYKFRTMKITAPQNRPSHELTGEERRQSLTRAGHFLRRTSLDELPQLWNVLRGEMSLIGPRPVIPEERALHALRLVRGGAEVRPGITGLAQIAGRDDLSVEEKAHLDALYARDRSPRLDLRILLFTVFALFSGIGGN